MLINVRGVLTVNKGTSLQRLEHPTHRIDLFVSESKLAWKLSA